MHSELCNVSTPLLDALNYSLPHLTHVPILTSTYTFILLLHLYRDSAKEYVIVFVRELLPSTAENTNQWRNVTVTVTAESVDQHQEGILRTTDDAMLAGSDSVAVR